MKNLIFICVFNNKDYIKLTLLLLESLYLYANLKENTDILIYTSTEFSTIIKNNPVNSSKIRFHIHDGYDSIDAACKSRLDFFSIPGINDYGNVLYLDSDVIIKHDLNPLFDDVIDKEVIYVLEEGDIEQPYDFWGHSLFSQEDIDKLNDKTAFSSGIILFRNCPVIETLFERIKRDIIDRPQVFSTYDQPYIVFNAMKYKLYDNKKMKKYILDYRDCRGNVMRVLESDKAIIHYCSFAGVYEDKYENMTKTMNALKTNKNLIFICVFHNEEYLQLLFLLLKSLCLYANIDSMTNILIYTNTSFYEKIQSYLRTMNALFVTRIYYHINDNYTTLEDACKSRLDVFSIPATKNYCKILYLDVDVIVKRPINHIFNYAKKDVIYAMKEGSIDDDWDLWGKTLFKNELNLYADKSAFSSGVMLFRNCEKIQKLFDIIKSDMVVRKYPNSFYDQPFIVYNAKKYRCIDNTTLLDHVTTTDYNAISDKTIIHYSGGVGVSIHKYNYMIKILSEL